LTSVSSDFSENICDTHFFGFANIKNALCPDAGLALRVGKTVGDTSFATAL